METINKLWLVIAGVLAAILQGCINSVEPVLYAIVIFSIVTGLDLITGIMASKHEGKEIESRPMRRCFIKWLVYILVFIGTMAIGVILSLLAALCSKADAETTRGLLLNILKWQAYVATYIEVLSIFENLHRKYVDNVYISIIYYVLSVQIFKQIPLLKEYFEAKKINKTLVWIGAICMMSFSSCAGPNRYVPVETTRYINTTETLRDTIIRVQLDSSKQIAIYNPKDTISDLYNKYCHSQVWVHNGCINHTLETLPGTIDVKATTKDKVTKERVRVPVPYEVIKHEIIYRDKSLNWYQETCIWGFSIILSLAVLYLIWKLFKWRLNIIQMASKIIRK